MNKQKKNEEITLGSLAYRKYLYIVENETLDVKFGMDVSGGMAEII